MKRSPAFPLVLAIVSGVLWAGCGGADEAAPEEALTTQDPVGVNGDAARILFYTNNVENLPTSKLAAGDGPTCPGDWQDLLYYVKQTGVAPDFFVVQQISDSAQLDTKLAAKMLELLGVEYGTIIAEQSPAYWAASDCSTKHYQTNAIVYRKSRFTYVAGSKQTWRAVVSDNGACKTSDVARYVNVAAKFQDKLQPFGGGFKEIAVGSVHFPVVDGCGVTNVVKTDIMMTSYSGAQMFVWGGDINLPELETPKEPNSPYKSWYTKANAALGEAGNANYRDPVYEGCDATTADDASLKACLIKNATMKFGSRYDFLFAKYKDSYKSESAKWSDGRTVGFEEAGQADLAATGSDNADLVYSNHRAVSGYVYW